MFLWFAVVAPILVAEVFRSPMIDYRLVALGALLPVAESVTGGPWVGHTLLGAVVALVLVMAATSKRRLVRRRLLGIPIGLFVHLVLDATWARTDLMWWPALGFGFGDTQVPEFDRPLAVGLILELAAIAAAVWAIRRYDLTDENNRRLLLTTGQLPRGVV